jgi:branched-chain amino acid transport system substrate-binding protein
MTDRLDPTTTNRTRTHLGRRALLTTGGALGLTGLAGCAGGIGGGSSRDTFRFGIVTSLSGPLRYGGQVTKRGYDLWKKTINEQGGIEVGGERYEVEFVYADAKSDPSAGADATQQMIDNDDVDAMLGPYSSQVPLAMGPILQKNQMPCITGSSESPELWRSEFEYLFGTIPSVNVFVGSVTEKFLSLDPAAENVYITGVNGPFSKSAAEGMRTGAEAAGVDVLDFQLYPVEADRSNIVTKAKSENPDVHMNAGNIDSNAKFMSAAKEFGYSPNGFFQHYGINTPGFKNVGEAAKYTFGATLWLPQSGRSGGALWGDSATYTEAFRAEYDKAPDYTEAASSATGVVYQQALAELGAEPPLSKDEQVQLVEILENVSIDTFWGTIDYEADGENYHNNVTTDPLTIQLDSELNAKIVAPESMSEGTPTYPIPTWDER